jgi:hypothetical protein
MIFINYQNHTAGSMHLHHLFVCCSLSRSYGMWSSCGSEQQPSLCSWRVAIFVFEKAYHHFIIFNFEQRNPKTLTKLVLR